MTLEQARHLAELINDYTQASIDWRELKTTFEAYNATKVAMSKYMASLVNQGF